MTRRGKRALSLFSATAAVLTLAASVTANAASTSTPAPSPAELLQGAMNAERVTSYVAQVQEMHFGPGGSVATISKEEHLAPDETHKVYLAPENLYGDSVVIHGSDTFTYDAKTKRVLVSHVPQALPDQANGNLGLVLANYNPVIGEPKIVAGRPTISCALVNRFTGELVMRLWIDSQTRLILQRETYHPNGTVGSRTQFEDIRYTVAIPPEVFSTPVPAGYRVVNDAEPAPPSTDVARILTQAGFSPAGPHYLPEGFALVGADLATVKGVKTLHLVYSDGIRSLSLFENASDAGPNFGSLKPIPTKIGNREAQYVYEGTTTLLSWKDKGLVFALVGDLEVKDLKAIAGSVS